MDRKKAEEQGRRIGQYAAEGVIKMGLADAVRGFFRVLFGACSRCDAPLSGPSPSKLCTDCHAAIVPEKARGDGGPAGEA